MTPLGRDLYARGMLGIHRRPRITLADRLRGGWAAAAIVAAALVVGCDHPVSSDPVPSGEVEVKPLAIINNTNIIADNDLIGPTGRDIVIGCTAADCDDGNACNGKETCNSSGACVAGKPLNCDDAKPCTTDACDAATGCTHAPVKSGTSCSDGNMCNGAETCDGAGACQAGTALSCDDMNVCTDDACDPATGCSHTYNTGPCQDGNNCTYGEHCAGGTCGGGTTIVCQDDKCNFRTCDGTAVCKATPKTGIACEDGVACTYDDRCDDAGRCGGTPITCTSDAQTIRSCNGTNMCAAMPRPGAPCDDHDACTKDDALLGDGRCVGTPYTCPLTACLSVNACDGKGGCNPTAKMDGTSCDADQNKCTPHDVCKAGVCVPDPTPVACVPRDCNTATCDPATGNCKYMATNGGACGVTGCFTQGTCKAGQCSGTPKDCSAFDSSCTSGVCNSETGKCVSMSKPNGTSCETSAKCAAGAACFYGRCELAPMVCPAPTGACKMPTCDEASGQCAEMNRPVGSACDPGNPCVVGSHCAEDGSCVGTPAPNGDPCTVAGGALGVCALGRCTPVDDGPRAGSDGGGTASRDAGVDAPAGAGVPGGSKSGSGGCAMAGDRHADLSVVAIVLAALAASAVRRRRRVAAQRD